MKKWIFSTALFMCFSVVASDKVIYGNDDRRDVFEETNQNYLEISNSTAAMVKSSKLATTRNIVKLLGKSLTAQGHCSSENFSNQEAAGSCSGFLVGKNLLVTAGHCIRSNSDCQNYKWVFDYHIMNKDQSKVEVPTSSVFSCKKIIERKLVGSGADYALIELDREATSRTPLNFRKQGTVSNDEPLVVIGHPIGLPTKIADGASVRSQHSGYFKANLDTYGGNSGSAVFNVNTLEVEGILVRGETDYVYDSVKGCRKSNICSDTGCRGEDVTRITEIKSL